MDDGGALCNTAGTDRSQDSGDTGTDILTEQHIDSLWQTDYTAAGKCLQDADRRRGGLNDGSKNSTSKDAQNRVGEAGDDVDKGLRFAQRNHCRTHHIHTDEQNTQTGDNLAVMMQLFIFQKDDECYTDECEQRSDCADIQSDKLTGNGGTDVSTHDNPHSLLQGHHAGVYKADDHDGGCRRGLDDSGDDSADDDAKKTVCGQFFQNFFHAVTGGGFQAVAHHLHSVQEQTKTAEQTNQIS